MFHTNTLNNDPKGQGNPGRTEWEEEEEVSSGLDPALMQVALAKKQKQIVLRIFHAFLFNRTIIPLS